MGLSNGRRARRRKPSLRAIAPRSGRVATPLLERRLPRPAAEDARQDALLAIHAKRHTYAPSKPFGPWVAAIARHKWIDYVQDLSRFSVLSLHDEIPTEDRGEAAISAVAVDDLLRRLKPAQARVICLVKLEGFSIEGASGATGQSAALVKVNIHRGLKKLAAFAAADVVTSAAAAKRAGRTAQIIRLRKERAALPTGPMNMSGSQTMASVVPGGQSPLGTSSLKKIG
jgi:RNA polymerase sigma factor (sigma-70 family)